MDISKNINYNSPIFKEYSQVEIIKELNKCETLEYYRSGTLGTSSFPQHIFLSILLRKNPEIKVSDFDTRLPGNFDKFIQGVYTGDQLYIDLASLNKNERKFFHPTNHLEKGQYPKSVHKIILDIFRNGHSQKSTLDLLKALSERKMHRKHYYHTLRAASVGAGKSKSEIGVHKLIIEKYTNFINDSSEDLDDYIQRLLLMRATAYSYAIIGDIATALEMVRISYKGISEIRLGTPLNDEVKYYQLTDILFPTLETLSLCESLWGDSKKSLEHAEELCNLFPFDARARIRFAKSLYAVNDVKSSAHNFLYAGKLEKYFFRQGVACALLVANNRQLNKEIEDFILDNTLENSSIRNISLWNP